MKQLFIAGMLVVITHLCFGQAKPAAANSDIGSIKEKLIRMEHDWGKAVIEKDFRALDRILADDWAAVGLRGKALTKADFIADLKSGATATQSVEYGAINVRVFGDTAVVTGSNTERATYKGHDSTGRYIWTDVFVKRNNQWQLVASQYTKMPN